MAINNKMLVKVDRQINFENPTHAHVDGAHNTYSVGNAALVVSCEMANTSISIDENMFMIAEVGTGDDGKKVITAEVFCTEKQLARQRIIFNLGDEKAESLLAMTVSLPRRGGRRVGSGRPQKLGNRLVSKSVTLSHEHWNLIDPDGKNYSECLRRLLEIIEKIRR